MNTLKLDSTLAAHAPCVDVTRTDAPREDPVSKPDPIICRAHRLLTDATPTGRAAERTA